jgi:hypothetical protein
MPMHGHSPAKLLPHKHRLLRLVAGEPNLPLKQIGKALDAFSETECANDFCRAEYAQT